MVESILHLTFYHAYKPKVANLFVGEEHQLVVAKISKSDILKTSDLILIMHFLL